MSSLARNVHSWEQLHITFHTCKLRLRLSRCFLELRCEQWQIVLWNVIIETDRRLLDSLLHKCGKLCFASVLHGSHCGYHFTKHDDLGSKHIQVITVFCEWVSQFFKWTDHTIEIWCKGRCQWWLASILDSNAGGVNRVPRADQVQVWKMVCWKLQSFCC